MKTQLSTAQHWFFPNAHKRTFAFVSISVGEAFCLARLAADQPPQVGAGFMLPALLYSVALSTLLDKCLLALINVSWHF